MTCMLKIEYVDIMHSPVLFPTRIGERVSAIIAHCPPPPTTIDIKSFL